MENVLSPARTASATLALTRVIAISMLIACAQNALGAETPAPVAPKWHGEVPSVIVGEEITLYFEGTGIEGKLEVHSSSSIKTDVYCGSPGPPSKLIPVCVTPTRPGEYVIVGHYFSGDDEQVRSIKLKSTDDPFWVSPLVNTMVPVIGGFLLGFFGNFATEKLKAWSDARAYARKKAQEVSDQVIDKLLPELQQHRTQLESLATQEAPTRVRPPSKAAIEEFLGLRETIEAFVNLSSTSGTFKQIAEYNRLISNVSFEIRRQNAKADKDYTKLNQAAQLALSAVNKLIGSKNSES